MNSKTLQAYLADSYRQNVRDHIVRVHNVLPDGSTQYIIRPSVASLPYKDGESPAINLETAQLEARAPGAPIETCSQTLITSGCEIKLPQYMPEGPLMLFRLADGQQLLLSARAALQLAQEAERRHCEGTSLLVDVTAHDYDLVKNGSRYVDIESHADTLVADRLSTLRASIIDQAAALGLNEAQLEFIEANLVDARTQSLAHEGEAQ